MPGSDVNEVVAVRAGEEIETRLKGAATPAPPEVNGIAHVWVAQLPDVLVVDTGGSNAFFLKLRYRLERLRSRG